MKQRTKLRTCKLLLCDENHLWCKETIVTTSLFKCLFDIKPVIATVSTTSTEKTSLPQKVLYIFKNIYYMKAQAPYLYTDVILLQSPIMLRSLEYLWET